MAPALLGAVLTTESDLGAVSLRIVEVEAYLGVGLDPGSHAFRGRTKRNASMFGPAGRLYAYFTYGMHVCANVVCGSDGEGSAVLLRAGEVVSGVALATERRGGARMRDLARGPARLTVAMGITLAHDGARLDRAPFRLELPARPLADVRSGPRTGVSGVGGGAAFPWRYWIDGDRHVSAYRRHAAALGT